MACIGSFFTNLFTPRERRPSEQPILTARVRSPSKTPQMEMKPQMKEIFCEDLSPPMPKSPPRTQYKRRSTIVHDTTPRFIKPFVLVAKPFNSMSNSNNKEMEFEKAVPTTRHFKRSYSVPMEHSIKVSPPTPRIGRKISVNGTPVSLEISSPYYTTTDLVPSPAKNGGTGVGLTPVSVMTKVDWTNRYIQDDMDIDTVTDEKHYAVRSSSLTNPYDIDAGKTRLQSV